MSKPRKKIRWFARGGGIFRCGPFASQLAATEALRQVHETDDQYAAALANGAKRKQYRGGFPADAFVWPEEITAG